MKVLLISHTCQSATEGQPKCHELARLGDVELCVLVPDRWKRYGRWRQAEIPQNAPFRFEAGKVRFPWMGPAQTYLHHYPGLAKLLCEFRPDVIDLWEEPWSAASVQACRLRKRLLSSARIVSETEQNVDKQLPWPFERFRSYTLSHADFVIGRNQEAIDLVRRRSYGGPAEVVPNAVDADLFQPMSRVACKKSLGIGGFVVGYFGRLVVEKGVLDLVEAIAKCPGEISALFVGSGPAAGLIESEAARLGVFSRVRIIPGRPLEELPKLMNAVDALALPSRTTPRWKEQFGRVIIEAHACGIPAIGSSSGAIPEVVGDAGLIVPEAQPAALTAAILRLAGDPPLAEQLGQRGLSRVHRQFTWKAVAQRMRRIYLAAIEAPAAAANSTTNPTEIPEPTIEPSYEQSCL